jgi:hypothetical protein
VSLNLNHDLKYLKLFFFLRFSGYIDPPAAGADPEVAPPNKDAMILCISNTGIFLLQSAVDIFVVSNFF